MWRLVSWVNSNGQPVNGTHPIGVIAYDASGNFSVQIMPDLPSAEWADFKGAPIPPEATKTWVYRILRNVHH